MSERPPADPLRVAVVVAGRDVPAWIGWTIDRIAALPELELSAVLLAGASGRADGGATLAGRLLERAEFTSDERHECVDGYRRVRRPLRRG